MSQELLSGAALQVTKLAVCLLSAAVVVLMVALSVSVKLGKAVKQYQKHRSYGYSRRDAVRMTLDFLNWSI